MGGPLLKPKKLSMVWTVLVISSSVAWPDGIGPGRTTLAQINSLLVVTIFAWFDSTMAEVPTVLGSDHGAILVHSSLASVRNGFQVCSGTTN